MTTIAPRPSGRPRASSRCWSIAAVGVQGATIVGEHAGELIQPWVLAIAKGLKIASMAQIIAPYPTLGEASKRAAGSYYTPKLFSERTRKLVRFLQWLS